MIETIKEEEKLYLLSFVDPFLDKTYNKGVIIKITIFLRVANRLRYDIWVGIFCDNLKTKKKSISHFDFFHG